MRGNTRRLALILAICCIGASRTEAGPVLDVVPQTIPFSTTFVVGNSFSTSLPVPNVLSDSQKVSVVGVTIPYSYKFAGVVTNGDIAPGATVKAADISLSFNLNNFGGPIVGATTAWTYTCPLSVTCKGGTYSNAFDWGQSPLVGSGVSKGASIGLSGSSPINYADPRVIKVTETVQATGNVDLTYSVVDKTLAIALAKVTDIAGQIASFASVILAALEFEGVAAIAAFIALGLIAAAPALLATAKGTGEVVAIAIGIRDTLISLLSAVNGVNAAIAAAVLSSVLAVTSLIIGIEAKDPPDFGYQEVPALMSLPFNDNTEDGQFLNAAIRAIDASAVNITSFERYQGALLGGDAAFANAQLNAFQTSDTAYQQALLMLAQNTSSLGSVLQSATQEELNGAKQAFLDYQLPAELVDALSIVGLTQEDFKELAIAEFDVLGASGISGDPASIARNALLQAAGSGGSVPEPSGLSLFVLAALAAYRIRLSGERKVKLARGATSL